MPTRVTKMKIKDNSCYAKADFSGLPELVKRIADKTLEQLEKDGIFVFPELLKNSEIAYPIEKKR